MIAAALPAEPGDASRRATRQVGMVGMVGMVAAAAASQEDEAVVPLPLQIAAVPSPWRKGTAAGIVGR